MKKTIKVILDEPDYLIIANEAHDRLISNAQFVKFCIAAYLNKVRQKHVFASDQSTDGKKEKSLVLSPERRDNEYLRELVTKILKEKGVI